MKRLALVLALTVIGVLASFIDAFYGLLLLTWFNFGSPLELTSGTLSGSRLSLMVSIVVLLMTLKQHRRIFIFSPITSCSLLFILAATASLAVSLQVGALAIFSSIEVITSVIVISLVVPVVTNSRQKLRLFVLMAALSSGLLAAYYGVFGLLAGSFSINGPEKVGDNNGYAVWVCSTIPLIFVSARRARPRWAQMALSLTMLELARKGGKTKEESSHV